MKDGRCPMGCGEKHDEDDLQSQAIFDNLLPPAQAVPGAIVLLSAQRVEGELVLETTCADYEAYVALPAVVSYCEAGQDGNQGVECGRTGWSSDTHRACYKSGVAIAHPVKDRSTSGPSCPEGGRV